MTIQSIVTDKVILRDISKDVNLFDYKEKKEAESIVKDLKDTVATLPTALGLAAPQISVNKRIFIFRRRGGYFQEIVNPVIIDRTDATFKMIEGCFSCPDEKVEVNRSVNLKVEGYKVDGMPFRAELIGEEAFAFQHELDHLNGVLIIDFKIEEPVEENIEETVDETVTTDVE